MLDKYFALRESRRDILTYYMIGAIQDAPGCGKPWRQRLWPQLAEAGIIGFIPNSLEESLETLQIQKASPGGQIEITAEDIVQKRLGWKKSGHWDLLHEHMKPIRWMDILMVLSSDFSVLRWEVGRDRGGTLRELYTAISCGVPMYVEVIGPKARFNDWVSSELYGAEYEEYSPELKDILGRGITRFVKQFDSTGQLVEYLKQEKKNLLAKRKALKQNGILDMRKLIVPLAHYPGALLHFVMESSANRITLREFLERHPEYNFQEPEGLDDIITSALQRGLEIYDRARER